MKCCSCPTLLAGAARPREVSRRWPVGNSVSPPNGTQEPFSRHCSSFTWHLTKRKLENLPLLLCPASMLPCCPGCKRMISQGSAQPGSCREPLCKQFLLQEKPGALYAAIVPQTPGSPPARFSNRRFQVIPLTLKSFFASQGGEL